VYAVHLCWWLALALALLRFSLWLALAISVTSWCVDSSSLLSLCIYFVYFFWLLLCSITTI